MKKKLPVWRIALRVLAVALALILLLALAIAVIPATERVDKTAAEGAGDWMARLDDETPLNEIVLPGTHDSATKFVQLAFFSKCQALTIHEQLEAGFRYLDIRLGIDEGQMKLMHGFTECRLSYTRALYLSSVLDDCYNFLTAHPTETIVFAVKQEHGDESVAEFQNLLNNYVNQNPGLWLDTDTIPTLGEARGRLVLLRRFDDEAALGARAGVPFLWENQNGSTDTYMHAAVEDNGSYRLAVQDRYEYNLQDKWTAFRNTLAAEDADLTVNFLSTKGSLAYGHPYHYARGLNQNLLAANSAELRGWIIVDFGSAELASHIYEANFD